MTEGSLSVVPLWGEHAQDICAWRYPAPYDCYDMTDADPDHLLEPNRGFHAVLAGEQLIGLRSFGVDGRVPGWDYDESALDTGGGLRPDLVGRFTATNSGRPFGVLVRPERLGTA